MGLFDIPADVTSGQDTETKRSPAFGLFLGATAWLIPLILLLPSVSQSHNEVREFVAAGCALAIFVVTQVVITWSYHAGRLSQRIRLLLLGPLTVLSVAFPLFLGPQWMIMLPYLAAAVVVSVPTQQLIVAGIVGPVLLSLVMVKLVPAENATAVIIMTGAVALSMATYRRMLDLVNELRRTKRELARMAVAEERLRFSRDMHDLLGHSLLQIVLKAEVVRRLHKTGRADVETEVGQIETMGREALEQVRQAVSGYRKLALSAAIDEACSTLADAGIEVTVRNVDKTLPTETETALGWVLREGVTNVIRHSGAHNCEIDIHVGDGQAVLELLDDGAGQANRLRSNTVGGNGLAGLTERIAALDGRLVAGYRSGGGYRLRAALPMAGAIS